MRRISLKNEIGNILESSTYLKEDRNEWGENISIYQAESDGFRCSFAVSDRYPLSEAVEDLKKKAERMFRKPSAKIDRGQNFQKALLYINEHREVIPLVKLLREKCSERKKIQSFMNKWVEMYAEKFGWFENGNAYIGNITWDCDEDNHAWITLEERLVCL